ALRQLGFEGSILLVGRDSVPPYERPPLSKEYLAGDKPFERLLIRPAQFWGERRIELLLEANVKSVDSVAKTLAVSGGDGVAYGTLVWAAGGDARRLSCPGALLPGVHVVRDKADSDEIAAALAAGARRAVVVGGGYVGLEVAA